MDKKCKEIRLLHLKDRIVEIKSCRECPVRTNSGVFHTYCALLKMNEKGDLYEGEVMDSLQKEEINEECQLPIKKEESGNTKVRVHIRSGD